MTVSHIIQTQERWGSYSWFNNYMQWFGGNILTTMQMSKPHGGFAFGFRITVTHARLHHSELNTFGDILQKPLHIISEPTTYACNCSLSSFCRLMPL